MDVNYMRDKISRVYDGPRWKEKVRFMRDSQVMAIFFNFRDRGVFDKPQVQKKMIEPEEIQISIWDLMKGDNDGEKDISTPV